jgi:hypothetical protein
MLASKLPSVVENAAPDTRARQIDQVVMLVVIDQCIERQTHGSQACEAGTEVFPRMQAWTCVGGVSVHRYLSLPEFRRNLFPQTALVLVRELSDVCIR